jgi:gamma-glutamylcyclotransferase (GGCT)/AIG2-like uncharacterized protein YtfP
MLYFAYGSNLDQFQMKRRCPDTTAVGSGELENYRFIINSRGYASVIPESGASVKGRVWHLSMTDVEQLDHYEGVQYGTYLKSMNCKINMGEEYVETLIYIASCDTFGPPRPDYLENIIDMAGFLKFDNYYINELKTWLKR